MISGNVGYDGVQIIDGSNDNVVGREQDRHRCHRDRRTGQRWPSRRRDRLRLVDNTIGGTHRRSRATSSPTTAGRVSWSAIEAGDTSSVGNQITANRIFGNTGQAIDLGDDGVT